MDKSNIILALVGFSSAGKDTLAKYAHDNLGYNFVVSHSTRPMRVGESKGNPYYFINDNEMCSLFVQNKLIGAREYDSVYGKWFYAISKDEIEDSKKYVVAVDFSGFLALKNHFASQPRSLVVRFPLQTSIDVHLLYVFFQRFERFELDELIKHCLHIVFVLRL